MDPLKGKVSALRQSYYKWKSLRNIPFRKRFFVGYDLDGNTYWEFINQNNPHKLRRIVSYRESRLNWVDYKMPPQWMQWLRFTRPHHPTIQELLGDKYRQQALKVKVQEAEERWNSIPLKESTEEQSGNTKPLVSKPESTPKTQIPPTTAKSPEFAPQSWSNGPIKR